MLSSDRVVLTLVLLAAVAAVFWFLVPLLGGFAYGVLDQLAAP